MKNAVTLAVGLFFVLGGCAKSTSPDQPDARAAAEASTELPSPPPQPPSPPPQSPTVDWANYSPTVQAGIGQLGAAQDCAGLQQEFDAADANSAAQHELVGDGNTDLMTYIDGKLAEAGCYD